jgi:DNA-binding NtrC family response regulator
VKTYLAQRKVGFGAPHAPVTQASAPPVHKRPSALTEPEIRATLEKHEGNKTRAAQELGIALNTLKTRMKKLGIE